MKTACICRKKKAGSSDAGFCSRNSRTADEGKEIVEAVTLPDCKDDVEIDDGIADAPPVPSHNEAYGLINRLTMVGGTRYDCNPVRL